MRGEDNDILGTCRAEVCAGQPGPQGRPVLKVLSHLLVPRAPGVHVASRCSGSQRVGCAVCVLGQHPVPWKAWAALSLLPHEGPSAQGREQPEVAKGS